MPELSAVPWFPRLRCEFCLAPFAPWVYPTGRFTIPAVGRMRAYEDDGQWAVCSECRALIDREDRDALLMRSMKAETRDGLWDAARPEVVAEVTAWKTRMLDAFWANLRGPAQPITSDEDDYDSRARSETFMVDNS